MTEQKPCTWCLMYGHLADSCPDTGRFSRTSWRNYKENE